MRNISEYFIEKMNKMIDNRILQQIKDLIINLIEIIDNLNHNSFKEQHKASNKYINIKSIADPIIKWPELIKNLKL